MTLRTRFLVSFFFIMLLLTTGGCATSNHLANKNNSANISVSNKLQQIFKQSLLHLQQQQYDEAIVLLERFITKEKRIAAPYVNLGMAYSRAGEDKKAKRRLLKALRLDIGNTSANNELGLLSRKSGSFGSARAFYQNALKKHPDYLPARKNLGILCEIYLQDLPCALEHYQTYLQYSPDEKIIATWVLELKQRMQTR